MPLTWSKNGSRGPACFWPFGELRIASPSTPMNADPEMMEFFPAQLTVAERW